MSSLRRALVWPPAVLAVLVACAVGYLAWDATVQTRLLEQQVERVRAANGHVLRLSESLSESHRLVLSYLLDGDDRWATAIASRDADLDATAANLERALEGHRARNLWDQLSSALAERRAARDALLSIPPGDREARARAFARWDLAVSSSRAVLDDVQGHGLRRLDRASTDARERRSRSIFVLVLMLGASAAIAAAHAAYVGRKVVRPLRDMADVADAIGRTEAAAKVPGSARDDEVGVLARALERTTGDLVAANARLADALRARDEFLSIASHELKTPLTPLKLHLEMEARRLGGQGEVPRWVPVAQRQVGRLEALVAQLLDVTRIRAGRLVLHRVDADLAAVVEGAAERLGAEFARTGGALKLSLQRGIEGRWDVGRLEQVVANLVSNALKYAPGSDVEVSLEAKGGVARLTVRDHGPGIAPSVRDRLFQRFERAHETPHHTGGLGLGLYIVRQLIEAHGGRVWAEGEEGQGAIFVVELPRVEAAAAALPPARPPATGPLGNPLP